MGVQKLLLPFGGKTVISHIVDQLLASAVDKIFVVTGHQPERISGELSQHLLAGTRLAPPVPDLPGAPLRLPPPEGEPISAGRVSIVNNADYESGMLSSVRCGLRALPSTYWLGSASDQRPRFTPRGAGFGPPGAEPISAGCHAVLVAIGDQPSISTGLVNLMIRSFAATDKKILVPCYEGKRGHPILFSALYREEILTHYDDVGLRGLLHAHPDEVFELTVSSSCVLSDMDYPDDYRRELATGDR
jgi:molybdenum cofactor cytidylyltransferase